MLVDHFPPPDELPPDEAPPPPDELPPLWPPDELPLAELAPLCPALLAPPLPPAGSAISSYRYDGPGRLQLLETNIAGKPVPASPGSPPLGPVEHPAIPNKDALAVIKSNR